MSIKVNFSNSKVKVLRSGDSFKVIQSNKVSSPSYELLLKLDASDGESYGGSGTVWSDLVGSNNGTLESGSGNISYTTNNGGEFDLDGGTGTRISISDSDDISLSTSTNKAYSIWFNADAVGFMSFSRTILSKQAGNPAGDGFWVGINSTNQLVGKITSDSGSTNKFISGTGATISTGTWYMATLIAEVSSDSDTFKLFINSTEVGSNSGGGSSISDSQDLYLGNYHSGLQGAQGFDGKIAQFYVHSGNFTSTDVSSLFDATKSAFGY